MSDENLDLDTQVEEVVETEAPSMEDTIRQTMADIESRDSETEEQKADRLRDEKGRFASKDSAPPASDAAPTEQAAPVEEQPAAAEPAPAVVPPELQRLGLKKEEADEIAKSPAAMQALIRRSEEMHKGLEQYREKAQLGATMERAISPFMATLQSMGVTPDVAVQKLFSADHSLRYGTPQQKHQMINQIARDYGIDLSQVTTEQPPVDPQVSQLQTQLQQMQQWITQQNQAREWQERSTLNSEVEKFKSDPSNAYFEDVRNDMAGLLQAGLASDLKDAYDKAIYANPAVRTKVLAEQHAKAEEARKAEATKKAQAAKAAAAVNVTRRGTLPASKPIGTMDDTIREAAARLGLIS